MIVKRQMNGDRLYEPNISPPKMMMMMMMKMIEPELNNN